MSQSSFIVLSYSNCPIICLDFGHFTFKGGPSYTDQEAEAGKSSEDVSVWFNTTYFRNSFISFLGYEGDSSITVLSVKTSMGEHPTNLCQSA